MITIPMKVSVTGANIPMHVHSTNVSSVMDISAQYIVGGSGIQKDTTAHWDQKVTFVPSNGDVIVYSDRNVINEVNYPGVKIGDGLTHLADLPFVGDDVASQIIEVVRLI